MTYAERESEAFGQNVAAINSDSDSDYISRDSGSLIVSWSSSTVTDAEENTCKHKRRERK